MYLPIDEQNQKRVDETKSPFLIPGSAGERPITPGASPEKPLNLIKNVRLFPLATRPSTLYQKHDPNRKKGGPLERKRQENYSQMLLAEQEMTMMMQANAARPYTGGDHGIIDVLKMMTAKFGIHTQTGLMENIPLVDSSRSLFIDPATIEPPEIILSEDLQREVDEETIFKMTFAKAELQHRRANWKANVMSGIELGTMLPSDHENSISSMEDVINLLGQDWLTREDLDFAREILNDVQVAREPTQYSQEDIDAYIKSVTSKGSISTYGLAGIANRSLVSIIQDISTGALPDEMSLEDHRALLIALKLDTDEVDEMLDDIASDMAKVIDANILLDDRYAILESSLADMEYEELREFIADEKTKDLFSRPAMLLMLPVDYYMKNWGFSFAGMYTSAQLRAQQEGKYLGKFRPSFISGKINELLLPWMFKPDGEHNSLLGWEIMYEEARTHGKNAWQAHSWAFENWSGQGFRKFLAEVIADPITYFGFGATKILQPIPFVRKLAGLERAFIELTDAAFLGFKNELAKALPKTLEQMIGTEQLVAFSKTIKVLENITQLPFRKIPLETTHVLVDGSQREIHGLKKIISNLIEYSRTRPDDLFTNGGVVGRALIEYPQIDANKTASFARSLGAEANVGEEGLERITSLDDALRNYNPSLKEVTPGSGRTLEETKKQILDIFHMPINEKNLEIVGKIISDYDKEILSNVEKLLSPNSTKQIFDNIFESIARDLKNTYESMPALGREKIGKQGILLSRMSNISKLSVAKSLDGISKSFARSYLMFAFYTPMNVIENGMKSVLAGIFPFYKGNQIKKLGNSTAGLEGINFTIRMAEENTGLLLEAGFFKDDEFISLAEQVLDSTTAGTKRSNNGFKRLMNRSFKEWVSWIKNAPDRFFIKTGGRIALQQQAHYILAAYTRRLLQTIPDIADEADKIIKMNRSLLDQNSLLVPVARGDDPFFEAAGYGPSSTTSEWESISFEGFSREVQDQIEGEALDRALNNPNSLFDLATDFTPESINVQKLLNIVSEHPDLGPTLADFLVRAIEKGELIPQLQRIFDVVLPEMTWMEILSKPVVLTEQLTEAIAAIKLKPITSAEEFKARMMDLSFFNETIVENILLQNQQVRLYAQRILNVDFKHTFYQKHWEEVMDPMFKTVEEQMAIFEEQLDAFIMQGEDVLVNNFDFTIEQISLWRARVRTHSAHRKGYLEARAQQFVVEEKALGPGGILKKQAIENKRGSEWWANFYDSRDRVWNELFNIQRQSLEAMAATGEILNLIPTINLSDLTGRTRQGVSGIVPNDVARLYGNVNDDVVSSVIIPELQAIRSKEEWVSKIWQRVQASANQSKVKPEDFGWTKLELGKTYDVIVSRLKEVGPIKNMAAPRWLVIESLRKEVIEYAVSRKALMPVRADRILSQYGRALYAELQSNPKTRELVNSAFDLQEQAMPRDVNGNLSGDLAVADFTEEAQSKLEKAIIDEVDLYGQRVGNEHLGILKDFLAGYDLSLDDLATLRSGVYIDPYVENIAGSSRRQQYMDMAQGAGQKITVAELNAWKVKHNIVEDLFDEFWLGEGIAQIFKNGEEVAQVHIQNFYDDFVGKLLAGEITDETLLSHFRRKVEDWIPSAPVEHFIKTDGLSLPLYHGTGKEFEYFSIGAQEANSAYGRGIYFASDPEFAEDFALSASKSTPDGAPYIREVRANFNKVFDFTPGSELDDTGRAILEDLRRMVRDPSTSSHFDNSSLMQRLKKGGELANDILYDVFYTRPDYADMLKAENITGISRIENNDIYEIMTTILTRDYMEGMPVEDLINTYLKTVHGVDALATTLNWIGGTRTDRVRPSRIFVALDQDMDVLKAKVPLDPIIRPSKTQLSGKSLAMLEVNNVINSLTMPESLKRPRVDMIASAKRAKEHQLRAANGKLNKEYDPNLKFIDKQITPLYLRNSVPQPAKELEERLANIANNHNPEIRENMEKWFNLYQNLSTEKGSIPPTQLDIELFGDALQYEDTNPYIQEVGRLAEGSQGYLDDIRAILRERYPSGYIRIHRGQGEAGRLGFDPTNRVYTNVTSSKSTAQNFADSWLNEAGELAPGNISDVIIRVDDVISIGSAKESELIVRGDVLRNRMMNPLDPDRSPAITAKRQEALDYATGKYNLDFADYTSANSINAAAKTIYPFWSYEAHRPFWLMREYIKHPGVGAGWDKFMNNTDMGYINIPFTGVEFNPLRGSIFMGGLRRMVFQDYPDHYDRYPAFANAVDQLSRYGFYPNIFVTGTLALTGTRTGQQQLGEVLPPLVQAPLEAYVQAFPESGVAKGLLEFFLPNRFRDYNVSEVVSQQGNQGIVILNKLQADIPLTAEEQRQWQMGQREVARFNLINMQMGFFRLRTDERKAFNRQVMLIIEEALGIPVALQKQLKKAGGRLEDFIVIPSHVEDLIRELDGYTQWRGLTTHLQESSKSRAINTIKLFYDAVGRKRDLVQQEQATVDLMWQQGIINRDTWLNRTRELGMTVHTFMQNLAKDDQYLVEIDGEAQPLPITLEERRAFAEAYDLDAPVQMDPKDELMARYFEKQLGYVWDEDLKAVVLDWDGFFLWRKVIENSLPEPMKSDFISQVRKWDTDLEKARRRDWEAYISPYNQSFDLMLTQYSEEEQKIIKRAKYTTDVVEREVLRQELDSMGNRLVPGFEAKLTDYRTSIRELDPEMDAALVLWRGYTPMTDEAGEIERRLRRDMGLQSFDEI